MKIKVLKACSQWNVAVCLNILPRKVFHQLSRDVLALGGVLRHPRLAFPFPVGGMGVQRRGSGVGDPGGRHESWKFREISGWSPRLPYLASVSLMLTCVFTGGLRPRDDRVYVVVGIQARGTIAERYVRVQPDHLVIRFHAAEQSGCGGC